MRGRVSPPAFTPLLRSSVKLSHRWLFTIVSIRKGIHVNDANATERQERRRIAGGQKDLGDADRTAADGQAGLAVSSIDFRGGFLGAARGHQAGRFGGVACARGG